MHLSDKEILLGAYQAALSVADPQKSLPAVLHRTFPIPLTGRLVVVGAGKASASMADALERYAIKHWPNLNIQGVVVTRYHHDVANPLATRKIKVLQAAHPVPDQACIGASLEILQWIESLSPQDHLLVLISGGGSSLLTLPVAGISLEDIQVLTDALLRSGAPIEQMNIVRKHLSQIQGGNLARKAIAKGVKVHSLIISDVIGDQPSDIASGPCAVDDSTYQDALEILRQYQLYEPNIPSTIIEHLKAGVLGNIPETLKSSDEEVASIYQEVFASSLQSLHAAKLYCEQLGIKTVVLGDDIQGESKEQAKIQYHQIVEMAKEHPGQSIAMISGGETTVTIPQGLRGRGGRCSEFLLALLEESKEVTSLSALAADTDGIDGSEDNAGAYFDTVIRRTAKVLNIDGKGYLEKHDAYGFFQKLDALVITGPTLTNVNDFRILLWNLKQSKNL